MLLSSDVFPIRRSGENLIGKKLACGHKEDEEENSFFMPVFFQLLEVQ